MSIGSAPPAVLELLQSASSLTEQADAIRALKNDIVGHVQKQQKWVAMGILGPVVQVLKNSRAPNKLNGDAPKTRSMICRLSDEEAVRLQAIQLLTSFAHGGPSFLAPLQAAGSVSALLQNINLADNHPKIVLAALKALRAQADAACLASPLCPIQLDTLADEVFTRPHIESFSSLLRDPGCFAVLSINLVNSTTGLIGDLCRESRHQTLLAEFGVLDALATKLASFVVARGEVIPLAEQIARNDGLFEAIPDPAPARTSLEGTLKAISAIVGDSRLLASMLLYSPSILAVFPSIDFEPPCGDITAAWDAVDCVGLGSPRPETLSALNHLLPIVPSHPPSSNPQLSRFPPVAIGRHFHQRFPRAPVNWQSSRFDILSQGGEVGSLDDLDVPLIAWLIHLARSATGMESLLAISVLTSVYKAVPQNPTNDANIAFLVVPLLMRLLTEAGEDLETPQLSSWVDPEIASKWAIQEGALSVLARLIMVKDSLQKAAFVNGAVKTICGLLKESYDPVADYSASLDQWSSTPGEDEGEGLVQVVEFPAAHSHLPLQRHRARLRAYALEALASLAWTKHEYRKAICDADALSYIVESLNENSSKLAEPASPAASREQRSRNGMTAETNSSTVTRRQNPAQVLIAACNLIRVLSRSVALLRTSLQDAGVAEPLFKLLSHPNTEVKITAHETACNLLVEASPIREPLMERGVMKVLCENAHSMNAQLRLGSLWALKHLVDKLTVEQKKACLEELQSGWLVRLICDDTEDDALYSRSNLDSQQYENYGSQRSPTAKVDEDVEMDSSGDDKVDNGTGRWSATTQARISHERSRTGRLRLAEIRLAVMREDELNEQRKARNLDLQIQEQGLDFIRNLTATSIVTVNPGASVKDAPVAPDTAEMIDHLFSEVGQERLFEILASKLRPKVLHPFSRRGQHEGTSSPASRMLYPQPKVVEAVMCILVHIAASLPRHRQLVMAQTELMRTVAAYFGSRDKEVRGALCQLAKNLVWTEDGSDAIDSERRATELRKLGWLPRLEALEREDVDLGVRQQAQAAAFEIKNGRTSRTGGGRTTNH